MMLPRLQTALRVIKEAGDVHLCFKPGNLLFNGSNLFLNTLLLLLPGLLFPLQPFLLFTILKAVFFLRLKAEG